MNLIDRFAQSHEYALGEIQDYLTSNKFTKMNVLVEWLITTDANPYFYLQEHEAKLVHTSAQTFVDFLRKTEHALYDDGEITFVAVKSCPRIVFADQDDNKNFIYLALNWRELDSLEFKGPESVNLQVLNILPNEFGSIFDEWHRNELKKLFLFDAKRHGLDLAISHYQEYQLFDQNWVTEISS